MQLIDSHAHLDFTDFDTDIDLVVKRANKAGVSKIINIGADLERSKRAIEIARDFANIWATVGIHPEDCQIDLGEAKKGLESLISSSNRIVAIGECGLDYFHNDQNKAEQQNLFQLQAELAIENNFPLVVHIRNGKDESAASDANNLLSGYKEARGVIHCFTLSKDWAKKFLDLGFYIGFTGIVTYKNAQEVQESAKVVPIDKLLIETDCPYLAPQKYRGQRNEPAYLVEVAGKLADIKSVEFADIAMQTTMNCEKLFQI